MRKLRICGLVLVVLAGCGRKEQADLRPPLGPADGQVLYGGNPGDPSWQRPAAAEIYHGRTAVEWSTQLTDPALATAARFEASQALSQMDEIGLRHLLEALKNRNAEVRLHALQALKPHQVNQDQEQAPSIISQLIDLLKDPNPSIREQAAYLLSWFDKTTSSKLIPGPMAKQRLDALQASYHFDGNRNVQLAARNSIISLYDHMRGTLDCPPGNNLFIDPQ